MVKLPENVLTMINKNVEIRPSKHDSNFNYLHIENVFEIASIAFKEGSLTSENKDTQLLKELLGHFSSFSDDDMDWPYSDQIDGCKDVMDQDLLKELIKRRKELWGDEV